MTLCVRCEKEFEGRGYFLSDPKDRYCPPCYGLVSPPHFSVGWNAFSLMLNYYRISEWKWFPFYESVKFYRFIDKGKTEPWVWALVANGDYRDIKEAHIRSAVADFGTVPEIVTLEEVEAAARVRFNANRMRYLNDKDFSSWYKESAIRLGCDVDA